MAINTLFLDINNSTSTAKLMLELTGVFNFQQTAVISKETAGRLIFHVQNTMPLTRTLSDGTTVNPDTWQIKVNVQVPIKLNPRINYDVPN